MLPGRTEVAIVGGGLTGLSAALALAARGVAAVVIEAKAVGHGASGVSGGQLIPGFRRSAPTLIRRFGAEEARALVCLTLAARDQLAARIADHGIDCDLRLTGHLTAARFAADLPEFYAEVAALDALGIGGVRVLGRDETAAHVPSARYLGGLLDTMGGHVDPAKLAQGLADHARRLGVAVIEQCPATRVVDDAVETAQGRLAARHIVLAADAWIGSIATPPAVRAAVHRALMPVWSYSVATAPLGALATALLPHDVAVSDTKFALDYYRRSARGRLLFSGGERYVLSELADIPRFVRPHLARVFPALKGVAIDHAWGGVVAVTTSRFPQVGRAGNVWWGHGYSGHGMLLAQATGAAIGAAIVGDAADFNRLARLPVRPWPGGRAFRRPIYTAGMLYGAARDRLRSLAA